MKFLLFFIFLLQVYSLYDTCGEARTISLNDADENGVITFEGDTIYQTPFCWVCTPRISCPTNYTRNYFYKFTSKTKIQLELSTCNTKTNYNTRIAVLSTCQATKAHTCVTSNDDDTTIGECNGGKSQIIFTAEANVEYYIAVAGSTASDVGHFQLTVREFKNPQALYCSVAEEIAEFPTTYRGIINEDMKVTIPDGTSGKQYYGTWFKYYNKLNQTVFIDTCGGYTASVDLEIMVYSSTDDKCTSLTRIAYDDDSCGVNPRVVVDFKEKTNYFILLSMKGAVAGQKGQYRLNLRNQAAENTNCKGAIGISSVPFMITMPMTHFIPEEQWCNKHEYVGMWYKIIGDGSNYIIDTCDSNPNGTKSGYTTGIEIFPYCSTGMIGECLKEKYGNCGDDAFIEMTFDDGIEYYIRATCTSPDCVITLRVDKLSEATNDKCVSPKTVKFLKNGDVYEQSSIDANLFTSSASGCNGVQNTKGAWYKFVSTNNKKTQHINVIVTPKVQTDYKPVVELHSDCNMLYCIDTSSNGLFMFQIGNSLSNNNRLLYATVVARKSGISSYGTFDFWAIMQENVDGDTYTNPIKIESLPYTSIGYITTNSNFTSKCYSKNYGKEVTVNGAWYTFPSSKDKIIHINTCGTETHIDTALEVLIPGKSFEERQCYVGNKDDGGVKCGKQAQLQVQPMNEDTALYCAVISDPETTNNFGTYRVSFFIDEVESNCNCSSFEEIKESTYNRYSYITKSPTSIISFNNKEISCHGNYYKYKAQQNGKLLILVDDLSEVEGIVALFKSQTCVIFEGINRPQGCEGIYTQEQNAYGNRGVYVSKEMKKNDEYMIFIGGKATDNGIVHFKLTFIEDDETSTSSSSTSTSTTSSTSPSISDSSSTNSTPSTQTMIIICAVLGSILGVLILVVIFCVIIIVIQKKKKKRLERSFLITNGNSDD